jgi:membrane-associated phospholipid phosphatase
MRAKAAWNPEIALWAVLSFILASAVGLCERRNILLNGHDLWTNLVFFSGLFAGARLLGRTRFQRVAISADMLGISLLGALAFGLLQYPLAATARPLIDAHLVSADRLIGFDWPNHFRDVLSHPWLLALLKGAYLSYRCQAFVIAAFVGFFAPDRARTYLVANTVTVGVCFLCFFMFPAVGAGAYFHAADWQYVDQFWAARAGAVTAIDIRNLDGIIQFPSYHAGMAVLFAYAFLALPRGLALPFIALNALMLVSAVSIGGHHLIDVIAGAGLAISAIAAVRFIRRSVDGRSSKEHVGQQLDHLTTCDDSHRLSEASRVAG